MNQEYRILNDYLNQYCLAFEQTGFLDYVSSFLRISIKINELVRKHYCSQPNEKKAENDFLDEVCTKPLGGLETLDLCNQFIMRYMPKYHAKWIEYFQNGVLEFEDIDDALEQGKSPKGYISRHYFKNNQMYREIDISLKHDYCDPANVIHEFCHQLNLSGQGDTYNRYLFSEMISIYFETLMFRFMEEKGYDSKEISKAQTFRIKNLLPASFNASDNFIFLRDFLLFGSVSDQSFLDSRKYGMLTFESLDGYRYIAQKKSFSLEQDDVGVLQSNEFFEPNREVNAFYAFRYVLGTAISYYAISSMSDISPNKILAFNDCIYRGENMIDSLKVLHLNMDDESVQKILNGLEQEFIRHKSNLEREDNLKK